MFLESFYFGIDAIPTTTTTNNNNNNKQALTGTVIGGLNYIQQPLLCLKPQFSGC